MPSLHSDALARLHSWSTSLRGAADPPNDPAKEPRAQLTAGACPAASLALTRQPPSRTATPHSDAASGDQEPFSSPASRTSSHQQPESVAESIQRASSEEADAVLPDQAPAAATETLDSALLGDATDTPTDATDTPTDSPLQTQDGLEYDLNPEAPFAPANPQATYRLTFSSGSSSPESPGRAASSTGTARPGHSRFHPNHTGQLE